MYSAKILGKQMDSVYGLYLPEYTVPAPEVQTGFVEIIGRDGAIDKTAPDGVVRYKDREWNLIFKKTGVNVSANDVPVLSSQLMNDIHGRRGEVIFDDDTSYKWIGRVFVQDVYCENNGMIYVEIQFISEPYKYGINEIVVADNIQTVENEYQGSTVSFEYGIGEELTKLLAHIEPIQDLHGYENPWPGGSGKNIFNLATCITGKYINASGAISNDPATMYTDLIPVDAGSAYTFSGNNSEASQYYARVHAYDSSGNWLQQITFARSVAGRWEIPFTVPNGAAYIRVSLRLTATECQVEAGSTATTFEPYSNICQISGKTGLSVYVGPTTSQADATTYAEDWSTEAGTVYGGTLDMVSGILTVDRAKKVITSVTDVTSVYARVSLGSLGYVKDGGRNVCNMLKEWTGAASSISVGEFKVLNSEYYNTAHAVFKLLGVSTAAEYNQILQDFNTSGTPLEIVFELSDPISYQLTPSQVALIQNALNYIWSDAGDVYAKVSTMDKITLTNGRKPIVPKIDVTSDSSVTIMFYIKGVKKVATLSSGSWKVSDLILFEGNTDVYESGSGTIKYSYPEASL